MDEVVQWDKGVQRGPRSRVKQVWNIQTQPRAIPFEFLSCESFLGDAQKPIISSHFLDTRIISSPSSLFQLPCIFDGIRIYRHSQRPRHRGDDFQAVRPHRAQWLRRTHRSALCRELKRRQKQREKEARRAENSANRPPAPNRDNATEDAANEEDLSPNVRCLSSYMRYNSAIVNGRMLHSLHSMLTNIIFSAIF